MHIRLIPITSLLLLTLTLSACGERPVPVPLPEGPQTATGVVRRTELSRVKSGSHELVMSSGSSILLGSRVLTLSPYEGMRVVVHGLYERNNDPGASPVLVVTEVQSLIPELKEILIPSPRLRMSVPPTWALSHKGSTQLLMPKTGSSAMLSFSTASGTMLPAGEVLSVGNRRAVRALDLDGRPTVFVLLNQRVLTIGLDPSLLDSRSEVPVQAILDSVKFLDDVVSPTGVFQSAASQSSAPSLKPCGGAAGILCPPGSFCEITDRLEQIGVCRKL